MSRASQERFHGKLSDADRWRAKISEARQREHRRGLVELGIRTAIFGGAAWIAARLAIAILGG